MEFDVYCDESGPELLHSQNPQSRFLVIGSLWIPRDLRNVCKVAIHELRHTFKIGGEFKWRKVSPSKLEFYTSLVDWYFDQGELVRFRAIVVDRTKIDLTTFHDGDGELGFYKFYYQLLYHWIRELNAYAIFCDRKSNRLPSRLKTLEACLRNANTSSELYAQAVCSEESVLIQLCDVLTGITQARFNDAFQKGSAKHNLLIHAENRIGHCLRPTYPSEQKFNIFEIRPGGGW